MKQYEDYDKTFNDNKKCMIKLGIASIVLEFVFLITIILIAIYAWKHF